MESNKFFFSWLTWERGCYYRFHPFNKNGDMDSRKVTCIPPPFPVQLPGSEDFKGRGFEWPSCCNLMGGRGGKKLSDGYPPQSNRASLT